MLFTVLFVVNWDMVMQSGRTLVAFLVVWTLQYPFGWMRSSAALQITIFLSVVTMVGGIMIAGTLKMLVFLAPDQVSCTET